MTSTEQPLSYADYLAAKRAVDDRALNRRVFDAVLRALDSASPPLRVLEVGAGVGTMLARLVEWGLLRRAEYALLDSDPETIVQAQHWLAAWAKEGGRRSALRNNVLEIRGGEPDIEIDARFICGTLEQFLQTDAPRDSIGLLIANAFLDLVDVPRVLPRLLQTLSANGAYWFSVNFDGETIFEPAHAADAALIDRYHQSMDERVRDGHPAGDSKTGRHLFGHLHAAGATIEAAGASDWVVHAVGGKYPDRDRDFVGHILYTIEAELSGDSTVDQKLLRDWLDTRRAQLAAGALVYIAHQIDFAGGRGAA